MIEKLDHASSIIERAVLLPVDQKLELLHSVCAQIPPKQRRDAVLDAVRSMPVEDQETVVRGAVQALPAPEQERVKTEIMAGYFPPPDNTTRDRIWMIIIGSFAFVLIAGFSALAAGMFVPANGKVEPALILSMFMSAVGFIGGLFVPSPASGRGSGNNQYGNGG